MKLVEDLGYLTGSSWILQVELITEGHYRVLAQHAINRTLAESNGPTIEQAVDKLRQLIEGGTPPPFEGWAVPMGEAPLP